MIETGETSGKEFELNCPGGIEEEGVLFPVGKRNHMVLNEGHVTSPTLALVDPENFIKGKGPNCCGICSGPL